MLKSRTSLPIITFRTAAFIGIGLLLLNIALIAGTQNDRPLRILLNDLFSPFVSTLSAAAVVHAAWCTRSLGKRANWAWSALAGGLIAATTGNILWSVLEIGLRQDPANSGLELLFVLLAYLLTAVGALLLSPPDFTRHRTAQTVLDSAIVIVAAGLLLWVFVVAPTLARTPADWLTQLLALINPVLDFVLFFAFVQLIFRQAPSPAQRSIAFIATGLAFMIATDVAFSLQSLQGTYSTGGWLDIGWTIAYVVYGLAGVWQAAQPASGYTARANSRLWVTALPYAWVFAVGGLMLWGDRAGWPVDQYLLELGFVGVVGLVVIRQLVALNENIRLVAAAQNEIARRIQSEAEIRQLNERLEDRVRERTAQLELANQDLQKMEGRNRVLLKAVPDMIFVFDREGVFLDQYANEKSELYVPPEQFLGRRLQEVLPAEVAAVVTRAAERVVQASEMHVVEYQLPRGAAPGYYEARLMGYEHDTVLAIVRDITKRRRAEAALRESERRFSETLANIELAALSVDAAGIVTFCNDFLLRVTGWARAEVLGRNWMDIFVPAPPDYKQRFEAAVHGDTVTPHTEQPIVTRAGETRWIAWSNTTLRDPEGHVVGIASVGEDITQRKQADEHLRASLLEKEVLLKEIHHRVKNNLQVVSSLLNLQSRTMTDPALLDLLRDSQSRIKTMALVHEKLYRSPDLARINFAEYARSLTAQLLRTYATESTGVALRVAGDDCWLDIDTAIPCGLILNELVSNALKHAFPDNRAGQLSITVRTSGAHRVTLRVEDDGVGFQPGVDFRRTSSLGLQLVNTLVDQIDGTIQLETGAGTRFIIEFSAAQSKA